MNFVTSDLHINHTNILKFCPESRGMFQNTDEMNHALIERMNSKVTNNDTLYIVGDIGFGKMGAICEVLKQINGEKVIIRGNHDRKLLASSEFQTQKGLMGVRNICHYYTLYETIDSKKCEFHMFHFPIEEWENCHHGAYHLHGHRHSPKSQLINSRRMDIGVDSNDLYPYSFEEIVERLSPFAHTAQKDY